MKPIKPINEPIRAVPIGEETPQAPPKPIRKLKVTPIGSSSAKKIKLRTS